MFLAERWPVRSFVRTHQVFRHNSVVESFGADSLAQASRGQASVRSGALEKDDDWAQSRRLSRLNVQIGMRAIRRSVRNLGT